MWQHHNLPVVGVDHLDVDDEDTVLFGSQTEGIVVGVVEYLILSPQSAWWQIPFQHETILVILWKYKTMYK